jgi:hypothetical protein
MCLAQVVTIEDRVSRTRVAADMRGFVGRRDGYESSARADVSIGNGLWQLC